MFRLQRLPFVLVVASELALSGCATVKRLVPWGGGNDAAGASASSPDSAGASTAAKAGDKAVNNVVADSTSGNDASTSTKPTSADGKGGNGKLDLSIPAPSAQPPGAGTTITQSVAASTPATDAMSSGDAQTVGWAAVLHEAIQRNWLRPTGPRIPVQFSCDVLVKLTRSGIVEDAQVTRSCGHPSLDASVISAVQAASPLPLPSDMDEFSDTLLLTFSP